jgi:1-acyl-sn-glycerol-3-phosphate acyltransferase
MFKANRKPRLPNPRVYPYWRALVWGVAALRYQFKVAGLENIPMPPGASKVREYYPKMYNPFTSVPVDSHSFVLALIHRSLADVVAVGFLRRPFILVGKPYFAMIPGIKWFFEINGLLPVFRPGEDDKGSKFLIAWRRRVSLKSDEMIERAVRAAKLGMPVEIYPQGTRDKEDVGLKGRFGAIQIAMEAGVPLIPAGIYYGGRKGLLRRRQVAMVIGTPRVFSECSFNELTKVEKIIMADTWRSEVHRLRDEAKLLLEG